MANEKFTELSVPSGREGNVEEISRPLPVNTPTRVGTEMPRFTMFPFQPVSGAVAPARRIQLASRVRRWLAPEAAGFNTSATGESSLTLPAPPERNSGE